MEIKFIPQGFIICFYGLLGLLLSLYLFLTSSLLVGRGFNEYNKEKKKIYIFRWGFPGKKRRMEFSYPFSELESIQLTNQKRLLNPNTLNLYRLLKGQRKIPII